MFSFLDRGAGKATGCIPPMGRDADSFMFVGNNGSHSTEFDATDGSLFAGSEDSKLTMNYDYFDYFHNKNSHLTDKQASHNLLNTYK